MRRRYLRSVFLAAIIACAGCDNNRSAGYEDQALKDQVDQLQQTVDSLIVSLNEKNKSLPVSKKKTKKTYSTTNSSANTGNTLKPNSSTNYNWTTSENNSGISTKSKKERETYQIRTGAICCDGTRSYATGRGACSHHGGVCQWLYQ